MKKLRGFIRIHKNIAFVGMLSLVLVACVSTKMSTSGSANLNEDAASLNIPTTAAYPDVPIPASFKDIQMPLPEGVKIIDVGGKSNIRTIEAALDHVAEIRKTDIKTPLALRVAPGDYSPGKTLEITHNHAAAYAAPLSIFAADFSKKPHIHGGTRLLRWKRTSFNGRNDVWVTDASSLSNSPPLVLLFNGEKMQVARYPNLQNKDNPYDKSVYLPVGKPEPSGDDKKIRFFRDELWMREGDVRKWAHPEDGTLSVFPLHYYHTEGHAITNVTGRKMQLKTPRSEVGGLLIYDSWCVLNMAEELDLPGEWYFNKREMKIYLITPNGSDPNRAVITSSKYARPVVYIKDTANLTIAGLEFSGDGDGFKVEGTRDLKILGCSIHDIGGNFAGGGSGLYLAGAYRSRIEDCDIYNIGNHGIHVGGYSPKDIPKEDLGVNYRQQNVIENNYIHHCGRTGIFNFTQGSAYRHNLIHDIGGGALSGSGYGRFCDIAYNRIRHVCITAQDFGAIYDSGWGNSTGTKVRYNWLSDVIGKNGPRYYTGACGFYFDECCGGAEVYGNIVEHAHWAAMHLHCARWLNISNNIFVSNCDYPVSIHSWQLSIADWSMPNGKMSNHNLHVGEYNIAIKQDPNWKKYPAFSQDANTDEVLSNDGWMMMGNRFENNIFYYPDQGGSGKMLNASHLNLTTNFFNKNIYWAGTHKDGTPNEILMNTHDDARGFTYQSWVNAGQDKDSIVADPLFVDPIKGDYRLRPESPALKLGFKQLPIEHMGLKKSLFRPVLPEKEAEGLREHPEWLMDDFTAFRSPEEVKDYLAIDISRGLKTARFGVTKIARDKFEGLSEKYKTDVLLLARIPAGNFKMRGVQPVTFTNDFYMGVFEVTQKQYENVVGANPSVYKGEKRPVESLTWNEATNFCAVLSKKTGLNIALPTEARWEYACRAGTTTKFNNGADVMDELNARYAETQMDGLGGNYREHTTVGSYRPNAWGLYDMHGNVCEWCWDVMNWSTSVDPVTDPKGWDHQPYHRHQVIRGGSWNDTALGCASSFRFYNTRLNRYPIFGLRITAEAGK